MRGVIVEPGVVSEPVSTGLAAAALAADTTIVVWDVDALDPVGALLIDGPASSFGYTVTDPASGLVTLSAAVGEDTDEDTTVTPLDAQGKPLSRMVAHVSLHEGAPPVVCMVPSMMREKFPAETDMVGQVVEVDSSARVVDLPSQRPYLDPAMLLQAEVSADTAASIPNGTFEQRDPLGLKPFAQWHSSWPLVADWRVVAVEDEGTIAGSRSCGIEMDADSAYGTVVTDQKWPVAGGQVVSARVKVRADRAAAGAGPLSGLAALRVQTAPEGTDPDSIFSSAAWVDLAFTTALNPDEDLVLEGSATVPNGHAWLRFQLQANHPADGLGPVTVIFDQVERLDTPTPVTTVQLDSATTYVDGLLLGDWIDRHLAGTSQVFTATASTSYEGSGTLKSWDTERMYQGYTGARGQRRAACTFDASAISTWRAARTITAGWVGVSVSYAPSAADSLRIGWHTSATLPATYGAITGKAEGVQTANPAHDGSVVWIPLAAAVIAAINAGTFRGLLIGPGLTTADKYVYQLDGVGMANPPQLRLEV